MAAESKTKRNPTGTAASEAEASTPVPREDKKPKKAKKPKKKAKTTVLDDLCKGCGICVAFCPTQTLGFEAGKAKVVAQENCILCGFCELRCPDFAVSVEEAP